MGILTFNEILPTLTNLKLEGFFNDEKSGVLEIRYTENGESKQIFTTLAVLIASCQHCISNYFTDCREYLPHERY